MSPTHAHACMYGSMHRHCTAMNVRQHRYWCTQPSVCVMQKACLLETQSSLEGARRIQRCNCCCLRCDSQYLVEILCLMHTVHGHLPASGYSLAL